MFNTIFWKVLKHCFWLFDLCQLHVNCKAKLFKNIAFEIFLTWKQSCLFYYLYLLLHIQTFLCVLTSYFNTFFLLQCISFVCIFIHENYRVISIMLWQFFKKVPMSLKYCNFVCMILYKIAAIRCLFWVITSFPIHKVDFSEYSALIV